MMNFDGDELPPATSTGSLPLLAEHSPDGVAAALRAVDRSAGCRGLEELPTLSAGEVDRNTDRPVVKDVFTSLPEFKVGDSVVERVAVLVVDMMAGRNGADFFKVDDAMQVSLSLVPAPGVIVAQGDVRGIWVAVELHSSVDDNFS